MDSAQNKRASSGPAVAAPPAAPAVVVVVVASDPGTWFEEVLGSLAAQDYPNMSVLVADAGAGEGGAPTLLVQRVAAVLPDAHLARVGAGEGFAQAANQVLELVEGATHVLLCHDDVAFEPSTVRLMVEEAYRSNAGLVCPKLVMWDATDRLLSVGMGADRLGGVHQLAQPGELDQGQHDGVREVFVAPGGATLVRTDLWRALGGFNPGAGAPGEDLDLCWRAQVAGARVIAAPQARVRHLEAGARGLRTAPQGAEGGSNGNGQQRTANWRDERRLREEHRLRTLWTCYGTSSLVLVVPVVLAFALGECAWALLRPRPGGGYGRHGRWRASLLPLAVLGGSVRSPKELWAARRRAQDLRRASDMTLWRSRFRGSARLRPVLRLRVESNYGLALLSHEADGHRSYLADGHGWSSGNKPSDGGSQAGRFGDRVDWRVTAGVAAVLVIVLLVGSRDILSVPLPLVGQIPSAAGGVGAWWHAWWDGLGPAGLSAMPAVPPGLAFMALVGTVTAGSASVALHVVVLGPLLVGPLAAYFVARRFGSSRGALVAAVLYAVVPVPYNALAQGHWAGLVAYGAAPWALGGLARLGGQPPFPKVRWGAAWARVALFGLALAVVAAFVPAFFVLVPLLGLALWAGSLLAGKGLGGARFFYAALVAVAVAWVALLPWSAHILGSWRALTGAALNPAHRLGVSQVLRLQTGPFGGGALGWAVLVAAGLPLALSRSWRLAWAVRLWSVVLVCMALIWVGSRGWLPLPAPEVVLAPAGAALALAGGVGGAAVEDDLRGYRFGWHQLAPAVGALAVLASALPLFSWSGGGQWGQPVEGADSAYSFPDSGGYYRVLWVANQASLPMAPEGALGDLGFGTSFEGLPKASELWGNTGTSQASIVGRDLSWARQGETTALGRLLAPFAVRYVVVASNVTTGPIVAALQAQTDLYQVGMNPAYHVFQNADWAPWLWVSAPARSHLEHALNVSSQTWAGAFQLQQLDLSGVQPLVAGQRAGSIGAVVDGVVTGSPYGEVRAGLVLPSGGTLYVASPLGSWQLDVDGRFVPGRSAFGWASSWSLPAGHDNVVVKPAGALGRHLVDVFMLAVWAAALWALLGGAGARLRKGLTRAARELVETSPQATAAPLSSPWDEEDLS